MNWAGPGASVQRLGLPKQIMSSKEREMKMEYNRWAAKPVINRKVRGPTYLAGKKWKRNGDVAESQFQGRLITTSSVVARCYRIVKSPAILCSNVSNGHAPHPHITPAHKQLTWRGNFFFYLAIITACSRGSGSSKRKKSLLQPKIAWMHFSAEMRWYELSEFVHIPLQWRHK